MDAGPGPTPQDGGHDAGVDAGTDGGRPDAGQPDSGPGGYDAGITQLDAGTAVIPSATGWQFIGGAQANGPSNIYGVTSDAAGNIWVAGGMDGLFLLTPGATQFKRFTVAQGLYGWNDGTGPHQQKVISVQGGAANVVYVGYEGLPNCENQFDSSALPDGGTDTRYQYIWKSGDADRVVLNTDQSITVQHYDISSGPGVVRDEMRGREKLCTIYRIAYSASTNSVWFGGNHGVAWGDANSNQVMEHFHPAFNGWAYAASVPTCTSGPPYPSGCNREYLFTDAYYGMSVAPSGGIWLGGANRSAFCPGKGSFWTCESDYTLSHDNEFRIDVWPDQVESDSYPEQRVNDDVSDMAAIDDNNVWVASAANGVARMTIQTQSGTGVGLDTNKSVSYLNLTSPDPKGHATSLELDPKDGSLWIGFEWGGIARWNHNGATYVYDKTVFNEQMIEAPIPDIQSDHYNGQRRIIAAFQGSNGQPGVVGIYTGD